MLIQDAVPADPGASSGARGARIAGPARAAARHRVLLTILALATAVRFATLTAQSYWLDEAQAAHEVSLSFGHMLSAWSSAEWNPPLYLLIAWPWAHVFGAGEAGLRSLSAIFGIALVLVLYAAASELVSRRAGLLAALFAALNPFMIWYSQEAREYMLLTLLCALSLWLYARTWRTGARRDLVWWAVLSALALLTQYFAGFLVLAEGVMLIVRLRSRGSVAALALQAVVLIPFIPHVEPQLRTPAGFIVSQPLLLRVKQVPVTFALGQLYKSSLVDVGLIGAGVGLAVLIGLLLAGADDRALSGVALAAVPAVVVLVLPLLMALVGHDDYIARGLMPAWPPLAVILAAACTAPRARAPGAALAVVLLGLFVWAGIRVDTEQAYQRPDWRGIAQALGTRWRGPDARALVVYPGQFGAGPLSFYLHGTPWDGPGAGSRVDAGPRRISEVDIVVNAGFALAPRVANARLISVRRNLDAYLVARYRLRTPVTASPGAVRLEAAQVLRGAPASSSVMFQTPTVPPAG